LTAHLVGAPRSELPDRQAGHYVKREITP